MANIKEIEPETNRPAQNIPYQEVHEPFKLQFLVPGSGIQMYKDVNGVITISTEGGESVTDIVAGDNIELTRTEDGKIVISAVNSIANITAGQNVSVDVDPDTGDVIISSVIGGPTNEHYQGVFDTTEELIAADPEPANGDYGMVKNLTFSDGETTWDGNYKYCFYISGQWTVVDQMLAFTTDTDLLQQYYSVGGSSPVIYLHKVAQSGSFNDLNNVPIVATPVITVEGQTVTAECATEGAEIWYTTDGSMPHVNGTKYTGPVTVNSATTFRFVGIKNGMINSLEATASADYTLQPPTVSLDWHDGTVTMVNPNEDGNGDPVGTIYYTTDGSTPTSSSTEYTQPFAITAQTTFNMIVVNGGNESSVSTKTYNKVATAKKGSPSANWIVNRRNQVYYSITSLDGTEVFYRVTKDGTTPDWNSPEGTGSVSVPIFTESGNPTTVKVASFSVDMVPADILTMELGEGTPDAPSITFDSETGMVTLARSGNTISLNLYTMPGYETNNQGCHIYYTLDGSTPTENSTWYTGPFTMPQSGTVKAILVAYRQYSSDVASETIGLLDAPTSSIDYYTGSVTMVNPNASGTIYYTTDGTDPDSTSTAYSTPVTLTDTTTLKMVVVSGSMSSPVTTQTYQKTALPAFSYATFNPNTGVGTINFELSEEDMSQGIKVNYTTDGSTPDSSSPHYNPDDPIQIQRFQSGPYPKYIAFTPGKIPSSVGTTGPQEQEVPDAPTISVANGMVYMVNDGPLTYDIQLQTNNNVPTMGCRIYYTTDGSTPTENSTLYTGPFAEPAAGTTIKAILVAYGQYESAVAQYPDQTPEERYAYGVRHDRTSESPSLERIGNLALHASLPVQSQMRRCMLLDNGTVNYYLDPDDSTKKADGTDADLTGADGMYMVEIPEHWRKYVSVEHSAPKKGSSAPADDGDNYEEFWLSESALEGWEHVPVTYVSVDEACMDRTNKKLAAVVNNTAQFRGGDNTDTNDSDQYLTLLQRPASSLSWQDFYGYANNRGSGWTNYLLYNNTIIYWLYMVEYATTNSQATYDNTLTAEGYRKGGLGNDATDFFAWFDSAIVGNPFIPTGITNSLGNHTGIVDYTLPGTVTGGDPYTAHISSYRGIALPFGHLAKAASGVFVTSPDGSVVNLYTCNDPNLIAFEITSAYQSVRCGELIDWAGIKKLGYHNGNLYPVEGFDISELQPSDPLTSWFCDFAYISGGSDDSGEAWDSVSVPFLGGGAVSGSGCGFAYARFVFDPASSGPVIGSRLCFIPTTSAWSGGSYDPDQGGGGGGGDAV